MCPHLYTPESILDDTYIPIQNCVFRNVEELLKAKGEHVKRSVTDDGTTELTVEDIIGKDNMQQILQNTEEKKK